MSNSETLSFKSEVDQLLHLVTHSLYSNKEIFLRELISNSSDAIDKLRFLALSNADLYENNPDLNIKIEFDDKNHTITISDNGIGMNKEDVIQNLGTIAKSGTKDFLAKLTGDQQKDSQLIGQFGVGFYSAFVVADKVIVDTRKAGETNEKGVRWISSGESEYSIEDINKSSRGTSITLHLGKDNKDYASEWRLKEIITKYSDHICWPIMMKIEQQAQDNNDDKANNEDNDKNDDNKKVAAKPVFKDEVINKAKALWTLQKSEIEKEDYVELYKHISHDFEKPLTWIHNHVEGKSQYISLLYIPSQAPFDLWQQDYKQGLKLYVKRVFIMDEAEQFLPKYLRFVKGIIDSNDLPLNVSREILQSNKQVDSIKRSCIKKVLDILDKMSQKDPEKYAKFWSNFGLVLKEGPIEDSMSKDKIAKLLRFSSTHNDSNQQDVSLADYVSRMKEGQKKIYYITASSYNTAKNSPHLEIFNKKGIEVLLLSDKIDEWLVNSLMNFDEKELQSVAKGKIDLNDIDDEKAEEDLKKQEKTYAGLIKQIKKVLGDKVKDVKISNRLTNSPACVIADEYEMGFEMQRILQASGKTDFPTAKPILEINPEHGIIKKLHDETDDEIFAEWSNILLEQSLLAEGGKLDNAGDFVSRLNKMLLSLV